MSATGLAQYWTLLVHSLNSC